MAGDFEQNHGKVRLTRTRPSDVGVLPSASDRTEDHGAHGRFAAGNGAALGRTGKVAIRKPYREAQRRVSEALASRVDPTEADALLSDALAIFSAARREIGSGSVLVQGPTIAYAVETTLAGFYMQHAAAAGFLTEQGQLLHDRAMLCETQASRAMTAALAAAKALSGRRKAKANSVIAAIEAVGTAAEEEQ